MVVLSLLSHILLSYVQKCTIQEVISLEIAREKRTHFRKLPPVEQLIISDVSFHCPPPLVTPQQQYSYSIIVPYTLPTPYIISSAANQYYEQWAHIQELPTIEYYLGKEVWMFSVVWYSLIPGEAP